MKYGPKALRAIQAAKGGGTPTPPPAAPSKPGMVSRAITSGRQLAGAGVEAGKAALQRVGPRIVQAIRVAGPRALGALGLLFHSSPAGEGSDFSGMSDEEIALYVEEMQRWQQEQVAQGNPAVQGGFGPQQAQRPVRSEQVAQALLQRRR